MSSLSLSFSPSSNTFSLFYFYSDEGCISRSAIYRKMATGVRNKFLLFFGLVHQKKIDEIKNMMTATEIRNLDLLTEKGASSWLTCLPLQSLNFTLNRQEWHDAMSARYNLPLVGRALPQHCACGEENTIDHLISCKLGGFVCFRHNNKSLTNVFLLKIGTRHSFWDTLIFPNVIICTISNNKEFVCNQYNIAVFLIQF
eukprot:sb/3470752/